MTIEPTPPHKETFASPAAWGSEQLGEQAALISPIPAAVLARLDEALTSIQSRQGSLDTLTADDFRSEALAGFANALRRELLVGRGFVILRGLPIERYTPDEAGMLYWGVGSALGPTLPQNAKGDRLYSVRDEGYSIKKDYGVTGVRYSKTTESFHFHTDSAPNLAGPAPDIIGLLAIRTAKSGGESVLVGAQSIHNALLAEHPDSLEQLYRPVHHDRAAEWKPGQERTLFAPIFRFDGRLQMRYMRFYIEQGHEKAGVPLTPQQVAAFDRLDRIMDRPELHLQIALEAGDMLFLNNHLVLHSRTAFKDHPEPERRRHYARIWMRTSSHPAQAPA